MTAGIEHWRFTNTYTSTLPADPISPEHPQSRQPRQVPGAAFSRVVPTPVSDPRVVAVSHEAAALVDLSTEDTGTDDFAEIMAGNRLTAGMDPYAMNYAGHQFGNWAGQLGDGRAIALGEITNRADEHWTVQLKGAGPTPYSRRGDGRAVMRSSIREFLCSEAMHHLGIPTTRALCLVATGDSVVRDMFYDGRPEAEPGAICVRLAPSFVRFGNFELFAARSDLDGLRSLAHHVIEADYPHLVDHHPSDHDRYVAWYGEVVDRTAQLVANWMRVGFVHGVLNTDNMSILGQTIDYGPYGWIDNYDPTWTPNTTDAGQRRYRFGHQPAIAHWNLAQLANSLVPLVGAVEPLQEVVNGYQRRFVDHHHRMLAGKLGLSSLETTDAVLVEDLFDLMTSVETDMTILFRGLAHFDPSQPFHGSGLPDWLADACYEPDAVDGATVDAWFAWLDRYAGRLTADAGTQPDFDRVGTMNAHNPLYVLRNYLAQEVIARVQAGDDGAVNEALEVFRTPYDVQPGGERFAQKRPDWARTRPGCSALSCSS